MTTKRINQTTAKTDRHDWGFFDAKGRELGLIVTTFEAEYAASDGKLGYTHKPGRYFVAKCQPARGGQPFGAGQSEQHFKTRQERDLYLCRRMADSLNQAEKKAAK